MFGLRSVSSFRHMMFGSGGLALIFVISACIGSGTSSGDLLDDRRGDASYYGDRFAGKTTASGERFDPTKWTAAHPSLPFGTTVRVTRISTAARPSVVVRINDRGPFTDDRIIDLSEAAARELGMIDEGVVEVKLEVLEVPSDKKERHSASSDGGW